MTIKANIIIDSTHAEKPHVGNLDRMKKRHKPCTQQAAGQVRQWGEVSRSLLEEPDRLGKHRQISEAGDMGTY